MLLPGIMICVCIIAGLGSYNYNKVNAWLLWCFAGAMLAGLVIGHG